MNPQNENDSDSSMISKYQFPEYVPKRLFISPSSRVKSDTSLNLGRSDARGAPPSPPHLPRTLGH